MMKALRIILAGLLFFWTAAYGQVGQIPTYLQPAPSSPTTTTWNPADKNASLTLSNGNLTATSTTSGFISLRAVASASSGKKYWEIHADNAPGGPDVQGIANASATLSSFVGSDANGLGYAQNGGCFQNGGAVGCGGATWTTGDTVGIAIDIPNNKFWVRVNGGGWNNDVIANQNPATNTGGTTITITGPFFPAGTSGASGDAFTANFGGSAYAQTPPSGFGNW